LGKVMAAQGQLDNAIALFRQAVRIQPDSAEAHHNLAMALADKGIQDEAVRELQEAARIMQSRPQTGASR
jgi:Flp pilus assembly protein TadD